jgi:thymidylate synthase
MINIENEYRGLVSGILGSGVNKDDRTGVGTKSVFGRQLTHDMALGFPLLTNKKMYFNSARTELLWILHGKTDMKYLQDNNVTYWDADYKRSGRTDGTLGPVYGAQWRKWKITDGYYTRYEDQLLNLVKNIKENPSSRRLMVNAWNVGQLKHMALPPCHYAFQVYINDGKMDLMWIQRSADVFLGLPYDIAMYGLLLELLCKETEYTPGKLIAQLGDCHIYKNHIDAANCYAYRKETNDLPELNLQKGIDIVDGELYIPSKELITISNYNPLPAIPAKLNVGK